MKTGSGREMGKFSQDRNIRPHQPNVIKGNMDKNNRKGFPLHHKDISQELSQFKK